MKVTSNSAGAEIKLTRCVYSRNSEASVSNDGKIPFSFCFFFCQFSFSSKCCKDHNSPTLEVDIVSAKSKIYSLRRGFLLPVIPLFWK